MAEEDPLEREKHHWVKAKKWACYVLNRLYTRWVGYIYIYLYISMIDP